jgi:hypothetical protein
LKLFLEESRKRELEQEEARKREWKNRGRDRFVESYRRREAERDAEERARKEFPDFLREFAVLEDGGATMPEFQPQSKESFKHSLLLHIDAGWDQHLSSLAADFAEYQAERTRLGSHAKGNT